MAEQVFFSRAVGFHLPSAIPVQLENVDEYILGQVLVYRKKPHVLLPWRKHKLSLTPYSLSDLLVQKERSTLQFETESTLFADLGEGEETIVKNLGLDVGLKKALIESKLHLKGKHEKETTFTTDFGKIMHTKTNLFHVLSGKTYHLDTSNPIVRETAEKEATVTLFVISNLYEADHSNISVKIMRHESESMEAGGQLHGIGGGGDESVEYRDTNCQVSSRDKKTTVAFRAIRLTVSKGGELKLQLRAGLGHKTEVDLPFGTHLHLPPTEDTDSSQVDYYTHGLTDVQAFTGFTYEVIQTEIEASLEPLKKPNLQGAFLEFARLPPDNLRRLLEHLQPLRDALRIHCALSPNEDAELNPVLQALSPGKETQLGEIKALIMAARACLEFPEPTLLQGMFTLNQEKRTAVLNLVKTTPCGTAHHVFEDEGPFKEPVLQPILSKMGYSCPEKQLLYSADANTDDDMLVAGSIVMLIAPQLP